MDSLFGSTMSTQALASEILSPGFKISTFLTPQDSFQCSPFSTNSPFESPVSSPTRLRKRPSLSEQKDLSKWVIEIVTQVCQYTIQEFTCSIRKERVPMQKNILRKTNTYIEKLCLQLPLDEVAIQKLYQKIYEDQTLLLFALTHISKPLVEFLENYFIELAQELQITTQQVNLYLFQNKIIELIKNYIFLNMNITTDSLYYMIMEQAQPLFEQLAYELSEQTCLIIEESRSYIEKLMLKFKEKNIPALCNNKYLILSLFMELSSQCYQTIQDLLDFTIFHYAEPEIGEKFMKFIIETHDILILRNKVTPYVQQQSIRSIKQVIDLINQSTSNKNNKLSVYKIINRFDINNSQTSLFDKSYDATDDEDYSPTKILASQMSDTKSFSTRHSLLLKPIKIKHSLPSKIHLQGLFIEGDDPQTKYIVYHYRGEFIVVYAPIISRRWTFQKTFVIDSQDKEGNFKKDALKKSGWGVYPQKFSNMKELSESKWILEQLGDMICSSSLSVQERNVRIKHKKFEGEMDTMFGLFLANLSRVNDVSSFLQSFGENAVKNGCLSHLISYFPVIKDFLNMGGFGEEALITSQQSYTPSRSITPVSTLAISTSLVSGIVIGQVLIPLPVVGGIVGGLIGGYLGNKGITSYTKSRNIKKATDLVTKLSQMQKENGMWECQKRILDLLQLNFKILDESIPKALKDDVEKQTKWLNIAIFGYLSLYYHSTQPDTWVECLTQSQKYLSLEKLPILETLDNLKGIIEIIVKNL